MMNREEFKQMFAELCETDPTFVSEALSGTVPTKKKSLPLNEHELNLFYYMLGYMLSVVDNRIKVIDNYISIRTDSPIATAALVASALADAVCECWVDVINNNERIRYSRYSSVVAPKNFLSQWVTKSLVTSHEAEGVFLMYKLYTVDEMFPNGDFEEYMKDYFDPVFE